MKYNTTYTAKVSLATTLEFYELVRQRLILFFKQNYALKRVIAPALFLSDDPLNLAIEEQTRNVSFDTAINYRTAKLPLSHTAFLRNFIINHPTINPAGFYLEASYIWRDLPETPTASIARHELVALISLEEAKSQYQNDLTLALYDVVLELATIANKHHQVPNIYPSQLSFISAQKLEYEYTTSTFKEREIAAALAEHAYILENPGLMLVTGHLHSEIPAALYVANAFNQIVMLDRVNSYALKVASVSQVATGEILREQLGDSTALKQTREYQAAINTKRAFYEVKINLPRLVMALLAKGHVAEIQPDVYTEEQKVVKSRYKVDTF